MYYSYLLIVGLLYIVFSVILMSEMLISKKWKKNAVIADIHGQSTCIFT